MLFQRMILAILNPNQSLDQIGTETANLGKLTAEDMIAEMGFGRHGALSFFRERSWSMVCSVCYCYTLVSSYSLIKKCAGGGWGGFILNDMYPV